MTERDQSPAGTQSGSGDWREQTSPGIAPSGGPQTDAGYPGWSGARPSTTPEYSTTPVTVRRPDTFASLLLILAGIAAAVSLLLRWLPGSDLTGLDLVRRGFEDLDGGGLGALFDSGFWQPMAVVLGGGVLFVLGLLMVLPARTHRFLGVLALLVSLVAAAGVMVPLVDIGWDVDEIDTGFWFAVAVPALGLLGALKAMFTGPRYGTHGPRA
ncbi:hypothetical protein ACI79C_01570 [Geodermatophilus sp. SYSU D00697]